MTFAFDHSTAGSIIGGTARKLGFGGGALRYACGGRGNVNITPGEIQDLKANGIPVGIVLEHEANWLLNHGSVAARTSASRDITRACGLPDGVLYGAVDFDVTNGGPTRPGSVGDQNMHGVLTGLELMAGVIGKDNVGFYGSKFGIDWLQANAPWVKWFWQTEAWSMGQRHPAAHLFQRAQSVTIAGVQCDVNEVLKPVWGQRVAAPKPVPIPVTVDERASVEVSFELQFDPKTGQWRAQPVQLKPLPFNAKPLG